MKTVVSFERAAKVSLSFGGAEGQPATVVVQNQVTLSKKRTGKKLIERDELGGLLLTQRHQVPHISVKYE